MGRQLGVRCLVRGSVRPRSDALRVSLQLIEAATARILWSGQFDSHDAEAVDAQEQIARGIVSDLEPELQRSRALDPGGSEVLGYAGCALCDLGDHHRGVEVLRRALELNPSNAQAHVAMGAALALDGKLDAGIERLSYGMRISPRDGRQSFWRWLLACFLLRKERIDEALDEARASARFDPRFHLAHVMQATCLDLRGDADEAIAALRAARHRRSGLSLDEVARTHGKRVRARLALLWDRAT